MHKVSGERADPRRFSITYSEVNRLWCNVCDKAETLPDLSEDTVIRLQREHECGPKVSAWGSRGLA